VANTAVKNYYKNSAVASIVTRDNMTDGGDLDSVEVGDDDEL